ncbi:hypothetical protein Tco_0317552 [Tanacetum coccineum]
MTRVNIFVDKDTGFVKESSKNAKVEMAQESSSKRAGEELKQEVAKKQKMDDDQEEAEMKKLIKIVPDEEEVAIDAIPLATKPPSITVVVGTKVTTVGVKVTTAGRVYADKEEIKDLSE